MGHKIINRIPTDGWLIGAVALIAVIAFGAGWLARGPDSGPATGSSSLPDDAQPAQVEVVQTRRTNALMEEFDKIEAAVSVGVNVTAFQANLRALTVSCQRWQRSDEPESLPSGARAAIESAYQDCLFISRVWEFKQEMTTRDDRGYYPEEAPRFKGLFGIQASRRYGVGEHFGGDDEAWRIAQVQLGGIGGRGGEFTDVATLFIRSAMAHATDEIGKARLALKD